MSENQTVKIFDTTLRDGEQSPGFSMNIAEKIEMAQQLARLGVDVMEAGFPITSQGDFDAVKAISEQVSGPVICGLARAVEKDIVRAGEALAPAKARRIHTFIATSKVHVETKLKMTRERVVQSAYDAVKLARTFTDDVEFSCEDAGRTDWDYIVEVLTAAIEAGATTLNIPDTVGYCVPEQFGGCIEYVKKNTPGIENCIISVHCHNDLGHAVANSIAGVRAGARQVECTINGIGERAGNTSLEEVVMMLHTRRDYFGLETNIKSSEIFRTSRMLSRITGIKVQPNKAIVGANAFAHEAGIHQDGMIKNRETYEIMRAEDVGWTGESMVMGKHSGRNALATRLEALGFENLSPEQVNDLYERFKALCDRKKEIYDEDLIALIEEGEYERAAAFRLDDLEVQSFMDQDAVVRVRLKMSDDQTRETTVKEGHGPVDTLYRALETLTEMNVQLVDYQIESITKGKDAQGRVKVIARIDGREVRGFGIDTDVIKASAEAYLNAVNRHLLMQAMAAEQEPSVGKQP